MPPKYERIPCELIEVGDRVAHARTHVFREITQIKEGPIARTLRGLGGETGAPVRHLVTFWRPRRTTMLWREVPDYTEERDHLGE